MGKCLGRCSCIQYETKWPESRTIHITIPGPQTIPGQLMPSPDDITGAIQQVLARYNRRKPRVKASTCEKGCECELLAGQDPPWTAWKRIPFERTLEKETENGTVSFTVRGEVEMRKRVLKGVCLEREL
ncbi:MAG: hypothetical protein GTN70_00030 [Deltaproteobacteria bacterium]|nr:hypothetical protein [Deltaproteobacteria bacterium]